MPPTIHAKIARYIARID